MTFDDKSLEDFMLSGFVMSHRLWQVALNTPGAHAEMERAVTEKFEAATAGYWKVATGLATGDRKTWEDPAAAFVEPGRKTLRKNAKRLAGHKG